MLRIAALFCLIAAPAMAQPDCVPLADIDTIAASPGVTRLDYTGDVLARAKAIYAALPPVSDAPEGESLTLLVAPSGDVLFAIIQGDRSCAAATFTPGKAADHLASVLLGDPA